MVKKLLDQLQDIIRAKHYSYRTEQTYIDWVRRFILFHKKRHPSKVLPPKVVAWSIAPRRCDVAQLLLIA